MREQRFEKTSRDRNATLDATEDEEEKMGGELRRL